MHPRAAGKRAWIELSADALRSNIEIVRRRCEAEIMAVVKADGYGHGLSFVAGVLEPQADAFAVATLAEAAALRERFPDKPITLLSGFHSEAQTRIFRQQSIRPVISSIQQLQWVLDSSLRGMPLALKLDSGMGRLGLQAEAFGAALARLLEFSNDLLLMSHFACADTPEHPLNETQHGVFAQATSLHSLRRSFANSAAILTRPQDHFEQVRPGIMLYGASPLARRSAAELGLRPVMRLYARVLDVKSLPAGASVGYGAGWRAQRDCRIGIVSIGYGDGYPRVVNADAQIAIDGRRYPLVGRVSMDSLAFLVEGDETIAIGSPVELWGETIPVDEVAQWANTIAYELCCKITARPARIELE